MKTEIINEEKDDIIENSPWRRAEEAMRYFGIKRQELNCIATKANARKKISTKCVIYDIRKIEDYINNQF